MNEKDKTKEQLIQELARLRQRIAELECQETKQAERKYATIIETTSDGFWITDLKGRFIDVNDSYCRIAGYTREELLAKSIADVEATENPEETARHIKKVTEQGYSHFETCHRRKDGTLVDLEINAAYFDIDGGQLLVFIRDITERKRVEKVLAESEQRLKEAQALGKMGNWEFDFDTQQIEWSDEVYQLYERDKALGPPTAGEEALYYPREEAERIREFARLVVEKGEEASVVSPTLR